MPAKNAVKEARRSASSRKPDAAAAGPGRGYKLELDPDADRDLPARFLMDGRATMNGQKAIRIRGAMMDDGRNFGLLQSFGSFGQGFQSGGSVAIGDYNGDGLRDVIVGAGPGWLPQALVFSGADLFKTTAPQPYLTRTAANNSTFRGGVQVKAAPVNAGNPGFIERVFVMAQLTGTATIDAFSLLNTDQFSKAGGN